MLRNCGDCTACCEGWLSAEALDMHAGRACKHRCSSGCGIYEDRPENPCRVFRCGWLNETLPEKDDFRPDQCGAILLTDRPMAGRHVLRAVPTGRSVPPETLDRLKAFASARDQPLIWMERAEDFAANPKSVSTYALGSEDFLIALKWDFESEDVWKLQ